VALRARELPYRLLLPAGLIVAIGHVITQWAHLEDQIDQEIVELGRLPACAPLNPKGLMRRSVEARLRGWRDMSLAAYSNPRDRATVDEICRGAKATKPDRDAAAHAIWGTGDSGLIEFRAKRGKPASIKERGDAIREMEECARKISSLNALHLRLRACVENIFAASGDDGV